MMLMMMDDNGDDDDFEWVFQKRKDVMVYVGGPWASCVCIVHL